MTYEGTMVLPRNAVRMQEEEMRCVEGGAKLTRAQKNTATKLWRSGLAPKWVRDLAAGVLIGKIPFSKIANLAKKFL